MPEKNQIHSFEDLESWKACREIRNYVSGIIKKFPDYEKYALADGMRRSSRSTAENIAEGFGKYHYQEKEEYKKGRELLDTEKALLNGYIRYLHKAKNRDKIIQRTTHNA